MEFDFRYALRLVSVGPDRIRTMAALRRLRPDLSPLAAKVLLDTVPCIVLSGFSMQEKDDAEREFLWIAEAELVNEWDPPSGHEPR